MSPIGTNSLILRLGVLTFLILPACSTNDGGEPGAECISNRDFFAQQAWATVLNKVCLDCHSPDGIATEKNAALYLLPSAYPGFFNSNYENIRSVAKTEYEGMSVLLRKPLGEMEHGGGQVLTQDSAEYAVLEELVERLGKEEECSESLTVAEFPEVILQSDFETYRKATLQLSGRLPTADEIDTLQSNKEENKNVLSDLVDSLMKEDAFYVRLKDIFNDMLLTDRYLRYNGYAINLLNESLFPYAGDAYDDYPAEIRFEYNLAVAREPLELIAHVVREERPFTEILTASYAMMNPYSALIYNADLSFDDPNDPNDFKEGTIRAIIDGNYVEMPQAGLLSSPMFLNRFPSSNTNRNRHRARMVYYFFLATDILRVAERPIDSQETSNYLNPTRDDSTCNTCHRQIDPIAGAFQKYNPNDPERYEPDREWYDEMYPPGFGKDVMETSDFDRALPWLAERIVQDERFVLASIYAVYRGLIGDEPIQYPSDPSHPNFLQMVKSWESQDATFRAIAEAFVADNFNLKTVIRMLILSPYFRAKNAGEDLSPEREIELAQVGSERFLQPSLLSQRIAATTGAPWATGSNRDYLLSDYRILYGGMDSENVMTRLKEPNGIMSNVAWRMANEVSCGRVAWDFTKPIDARYLFPKVTLDHIPEIATGDEVPGAIKAIKENIRYLHAHILGETVPLEHPSIEHTYKLFYETWKEGMTKLGEGEIGNNLIWQCRGRVNPLTNEALPNEEQISADPNYLVRAWMAVVTYLLADYRFLYE